MSKSDWKWWLISTMIVASITATVTTVCERKRTFDVTDDRYQGDSKTNSELTLGIVCDGCHGEELFIVLNVGQSNVLDHYVSKYFCVQCDTIRDVHVEIRD